MSPQTLFWTTFFAFLPISELRGAIPFALSQGMPWYLALLYSVGINALVAPVCWIFLSTGHRLLYHWGWYKTVFDAFVERARGKVHEKVEAWGWLGIAAFVAIPLPVTGAWTGTLGAWILGLDKKKTLLAVIIGVALAGCIVTAVAMLGISAFAIFVKKI
ncbi:COG2426 family protein [Gracilinema caldarium]|uniref:Small multi-drug export protein n=1 Tax=Gracilinema caldarium (strain ATCC 51460 / DSM 7334 / H1) TaxID=744872 RepID=F8F1R4_GRAC1|nr:small multi-drug export protein [Gracilinema caldarium]AEJ19398.1 small multi-drug export protein [Gracilinema caldarium DSM 7334]